MYFLREQTQNRRRSCGLQHQTATIPHRHSIICNRIRAKLRFDLTSLTLPFFKWSKCVEDWPAMNFKRTAAPSPRMKAGMAPTFSPSRLRSCRWPDSFQDQTGTDSHRQDIGCVQYRCTKIDTECPKVKYWSPGHRFFWFL